MSTVHEILALARHEQRAAELHKGQAGPRKAKLQVKKGPKKPTPPPIGDYVRVHRPGHHAQPALARVVTHGRDGLTVMGHEGKAIRVRHEHVLESQAMPTPQERAELSVSLAHRGVPLRLEDRFFRLDGQGKASRRPTASQLEMLREMTQHGIPLEMNHIYDGATYDDAEELLNRYISDPEGRISRK